MWTLEKAFSRYGAPAREMNETFNIWHPRADTIESIKRIKDHDKWTTEQIEGLRQFADMLEEYRRTLYDRAQAFYTAGYSMRLTLTRRADIWSKKKFYEVALLKIYDLENAAPEKILEETYKGTERRQAFARFEQLKKQYPGIEVLQDTAKKSWEK